MVEKIYLLDSYKKELEAVITTVSQNVIELDRTIFYPTGGGQPCDFGTISINGLKYNVTYVKKEGERVMHFLENSLDSSPGVPAHLEIDWDRRYAHMRYHTALHVLDGILENHADGKIFNATEGAITGGQIYHDRARIDFDIPGFSRELAQQLIDYAQKFIDDGHPVSARILTKEEAEKTSNIARTEPGRKLLKELAEIRVVEISGLDMQLDGGTHVANTKEIGKMRLTNYESKGSKRKRIEIVLDQL